MAGWHTSIGAFACASLLIATAATAQDQLIDPNTVRPFLEVDRTANGLAPTPPMGWNSWNKYGWTGAMQAEVRDVWNHQTLGKKSGSFVGTVEPHGATMVTVTPRWECKKNWAAGSGWDSFASIG